MSSSYGSAANYFFTLVFNQIRFFFQYCVELWFIMCLGGSLSSAFISLHSYCVNVLLFFRERFRK